MIYWLLAAAMAAQAPAMAGIGHGDMTAPVSPIIMPGYGGGGFKITTSVPQAQAFFDNGMQLAHAFAHKAAVQAFQESVRLDPKCAMCVWGQAWADGPTINFGKTEDEVSKLAELATRAADLAKDAGTDREREMIHALQLRYKDGGGGKAGDLRFAKAMAGLAERYPDDDEIAVIAADAWLMTHSDSHEDDKLNALLAMPLLERVLKRNPDYTPAIHFYIHATETADVPKLAEPYADRLAMLAPNASHLVHMPSHTWYWVGRYEDAARTNKRAVELGVENAKRLGLPPPDGAWGLPYHSHNIAFGLGGALEAGDSAIGLEFGRAIVNRLQGRDKGPAGMQLASTLGYMALAQFASTKEVLALPEPKLPFMQAAWHYARGEAFARLRDTKAVRNESAAIHGVAGPLSKDDASLQAQTMTFIARNVLVGRAAMLDQHPADAIVAFRQAAEQQEGEDFSAMSDPPFWGYPVRRDLAEALAANGDIPAARREAEAALKYRPQDPGTLALLSKLEARTAAR